MATVSMALHVGYMQSLCKKEWRTGRQMILSAVRHGVAKEFIRFCAGLRVNKWFCITLDRICMVLARKQWPRWLTNFSRRPIMYGWVCVAWCCLKRPSSVVRAPLQSCGQTAASWCTHVSPSHPGCLLQTRGHCSSGNWGVALFAVNCGVGGQLVACPCSGQSSKPNVCLDVTTIAVLHTTPLPHFLRHPSLRDLVDRVTQWPWQLFDSGRNLEGVR